LEIRKRRLLPSLQFGEAHSLVSNAHTSLLYCAPSPPPKTYRSFPTRVVECARSLGSFSPDALTTDQPRVSAGKRRDRRYERPEDVVQPLLLTCVKLRYTRPASSDVRSTYHVYLLAYQGSRMGTKGLRRRHAVVWHLIKVHGCTKESKSNPQIGQGAKRPILT
jgi:hypothetical protein